MMQEFVLLLLLIFGGVSWVSMLRRGIKPRNSFTGARDYARSAVASWTIDVRIRGIYYWHAGKLKKYCSLIFYMR